MDHLTDPECLALAFVFLILNSEYSFNMDFMSWGLESQNVCEYHQYGLGSQSRAKSCTHYLELIVISSYIVIETYVDSILIVLTVLH